MKKILPFIVLMMVSFASFAQDAEGEKSKSTQENDAEETTDLGVNELKLNIFSGVLSTINLSYERIFKDNTAIGLAAAYGFYPEHYEGGGAPGYLWSFMPHYRLYFGKKQAAGLFLEANAHVAQTRAITGYSYSDELGNWISNTTYHDKIGYGVGFAVGAKFLTAKGLIGEVFGGAGRYFNTAERMPEIYPRIGVMIGKRF